MAAIMVCMRERHKQEPKPNDRVGVSIVRTTFYSVFMVVMAYTVAILAKWLLMLD